MSFGIDTASQPSTYVGYLPSIYRDDPFLASLLKIFEEVMSGDLGPRQVRAIASDTTLMLDQPVTVAGPPGVTVARVEMIGLAGTVHTRGAGTTTLHGLGTAFTRELDAWDVISIAGVGTRAITAIASDTSLTLDRLVTIAGPPGTTAARVETIGLAGTVHTGGATTTTLVGEGTSFTA